MQKREEAITAFAVSLEFTELLQQDTTVFLLGRWMLVAESRL